MEPRIDLELFTIDELVDELFRRGEHCIFSILKITVDNEDGSGDNYARHFWRGYSLTCVGLATELQHHILKERVLSDDQGRPYDDGGE